MQASSGGGGGYGRALSGSVSDHDRLYACDEVSLLLLEELRDLEPRTELDLQDFEIAGSRTGAGALLGGGGSEGGTVGATPDGETTVRSWDSHPNYARAPPPPPQRVAPVYCSLGHLLTAAGALRACVAACSLCCVALEYGGGGAELFLLPAAGRLRLLLATALFALMASLALLFLDVSRLRALFPFNWAKLNACLYAAVGAFYLVAGAATLLAALSDEYWWVPAATRDALVAAASFGLIASLASGAASLVYCYRRPPASSTSALLGGGGATPSPSGSPMRRSPSPPPSSRRAPLYAPVPPAEPDPRPCSSKTPL